MLICVRTDITITGSKSEIDKIIAASKLNPELFGDRHGDQVFDFNGFIPMPEKFNDTWALNNWGTERNSANIFADVSTYGEETTLSLVMDTAWTVPVPILNHIKENYNVTIDGLAADEVGDLAAVINDAKDKVEVQFYPYSEENIKKINSICLDVLGFEPICDED